MALSRKGHLFKAREPDQEAEGYPVPPQLGTGKLKFFAALCMSPMTTQAPR